MIGLENQFGLLFEWPLKTGLIVICLKNFSFSPFTIVGPCSDLQDEIQWLTVLCQMLIFYFILGDPKFWYMYMEILTLPTECKSNLCTGIPYSSAFNDFNIFYAILNKSVR